MSMQIIIIFAVMLAVFGGAFFLIDGHFKEARAKERRQQVAQAAPRSKASRAAEREAGSRRQQVESSLKEIERKRTSTSKVPLRVRIEQAGLDWTPKKFYLISTVLGLAVLVVTLVVMNMNIFVVLGLTFAAFFGVPRWYIYFRRKRRIEKFIHEFPNAIDIVVRGLRAGLPLGDCIRIIASEAQEPVATEFRKIVEMQALGLGLAEASEKLFERIPVQEANFFGIVIAIQAKAGGNLSEAFGNLARVLRERKKMKAKIKAVSMEAKASAAIIGCLPVAVMLLVYLTTPGYIATLWLTSTGRALMLGCVVWMSIGVLVMRKMINFNI